MSEKRRKKGTGSFYQADSGNWVGRYSVGTDPVTGKRIQKTITRETLRECQAAVKEAIAKANGTCYINHDFTVREWLTTWFTTYSEPTIRPTTAEKYRNIINHHIIPRIGNVHLRSLSTILIQKMYNEEMSQDQSPEGETPVCSETVRKIHMVLRMVLNQAAKEGIIQMNPCNYCTLPPKERKEIKIIPLDQIGNYLNAAEKFGVYPTFYLELSTGLRRGEILALQWDDLDVANQMISVNKQVAWLNGNATLLPPKTANSTRKIAISKSVVDVLVAEREKNPDKVLMFPAPGSTVYWHPSSLARVHKKILRECGLDDDIRFHDLRHTFATMALENGMDIKTLSSVIGHKSSATTLDIYAHTTDAMQHNAAANIERGIGENDAQEETEVPSEKAEMPMTDFVAYKGKIRKPGTGCITEINDHLFEGRYSPMWVDGKKRGFNVYAKTREEVEVKLQLLIAEKKAELAKLRKR